MTLEEKMALLREAKALGCSTVKIDGAEFILREDAPAKDVEIVPDRKAEELLKPISPLDDISDEECLYYATPYYDHLQAKKAQEKIAKENGVENG